MKIRQKNQVTGFLTVPHTSQRTSYYQVKSTSRYTAPSSEAKPVDVVPEGFSKPNEMIRNSATNKLQRRPAIAPYSPRQLQVTSEFLAKFKKSSDVNTELPREIVSLG